MAVGRAIDLAHLAGADLRGDFIDTETRAGCENQTVGLYGRSAVQTGQRRSTGILASPAWPIFRRGRSTLRDLWGVIRAVHDCIVL